jgi:hypothetical protein
VLCLARAPQQRKVQESARYQTMVESIAKLEKGVEVRGRLQAHA